MQPTDICKVVQKKKKKKEKNPILSTKGFIDVKLLSEKHHKINLNAGKDLIIYEGVGPLLCYPH